MEYLRQLNLLSIMVRIVLAILIGGALGFERERKNRPAGFRTYILVCLGATLVMMTNQYVYHTYGIGDPVRMGAQVISGIVSYFLISLMINQEMINNFWKMVKSK